MLSNIVISEAKVTENGCFYSQSLNDLQWQYYFPNLLRDVEKIKKISICVSKNEFWPANIPEVFKGIEQLVALEDIVLVSRYGSLDFSRYHTWSKEVFHNFIKTISKLPKIKIVEFKLFMIDGELIAEKHLNGLPHISVADDNCGNIIIRYG